MYGDAYGEASGDVVGELRAVDWDLVELELLLVVDPLRDVLGLTIASWVGLDFFEALMGMRVIIWVVDCAFTIGLLFSDEVLDLVDEEAVLRTSGPGQD